MRQIILASGSPRRQYLLDVLGLIYECHPSEQEEKILSNEEPLATVARIAGNKAEIVGRYYDDAVVIAADTVVVSGNSIFGKPTDMEEAWHMLTSLNGTDHKVITALSVLDTATGILRTETEITRVFFRKLLREEIALYIASGEPFDKAGSYGIQGLGALLVERIEGCYFNVVGLPLSKLYIMLKAVNVNLLAGGNETG